MRLCLLALTACAGVRGSLDSAASDISELHTLRTSEHVAALTLGNGCYAAAREIYACSVDVLPVGGLMCSREPADGQAIEFSDPHMDTFERELNDHRCHRQLQEQLACDPVLLDARRVEGNGLADVPQLHATAVLSPAGRGDIYGDARSTIMFDATFCAESGHVEPSIWYFVGHGTTPFFIELLVALRGAPTTSAGCAKFHVVASSVRCNLRPPLRAATP